MQKIPFLDLSKVHNDFKEEINSSINNVVKSGDFILGKELNLFEKEYAIYNCAKFCIGVGSGLDALSFLLIAAGVKKGDEVIVPAHTFIATWLSVTNIGAIPVGIEPDEKTYNISPEKLERKIKQINLEGKINIKAIISVDLFGLPADLEAISKIAKKYSLKLIIDSAQGFGSSIKGKKTCSFGDVGVTSFFPAKPLGCYGDGGAIFTNDENMRNMLVSIRTHGQGKDKYNNERIGINGRLDTIQAAVLSVKFKYFNEEIVLRNEVSNYYIKKLNSNFISQFVPREYKSVWAQFTVLAKSNKHRKLLMEKLMMNKIPTAIYYPKPLHLQNAFKNLKYKKGDFPISEKISKIIFSPPMHPYLKKNSIEKITSIINEL